MKSSDSIFYDYIIIGAGASGMATALMLAKKGYLVKVIEAHSLPGGCGSFFKRKGLKFDVGATTLSGFRDNGPMNRFLKLFPLDIKLKHIDPGIIFHRNDLILNRYSDTERWIQELAKTFNIDSIKLKKQWKHIDHINQLAWKLTGSTLYFPAIRKFNLIKFIFTKLILKLKLLPYLFKKTEIYFQQSKNHDYEKIIDQLLLISAQNYSDKTPALIGAMSLSYPNDTWYCYGGIGEFHMQMMKHAKKNYNINFQFNKKVTNIKKSNQRFIVQAQDVEYTCSKVISTIPIWNTNKIIDFDLPKLHSKADHFPVKWGAITGYFLIRLDQELESIYHQIHVKDHSYFFSFSEKDDESKSNEKWLTLTISTHCDLQKEIKNKNEYQKDIEKVIHSNFKTQELECVGIGTPFTFEKFTSREKGCVGGIPHSIDNNLLTFPNFLTGLKNFYQLGDTTFPGQGIVGVIQGAFNFTDQIPQKSLYEKDK